MSFSAPRSTSLSFWLLLTLTSFHGWEAEAHGGIPALVGVAAGDALTPVSSFGIWIPSEDDEFNLLCEESYQGAILPPAARTIDGTIYVGLFKGVFVYEPASCAWTTHTLGEELLFVRDLAFSAGGDLLAVTSSGGKPNGLFQFMSGQTDWQRVPLPMEDGYFTSLKPDNQGALIALAFRIQPETNQRSAFGCFESSSEWLCVDLEDHGPPEREQPLLLDCHAQWGCLLTWEGDPEASLFQWFPESGEVSLRARFPVADDARFTSGADLSKVWGAVFLEDGTILANHREELYRVEESETPAAITDSPLVRCLERRKDALILCSDPFVEDGYGLATWNADESQPMPLLADYGALTDSVGCPPPDGIEIEIVCGEAWNEIKQTLGLGEGEEDTPLPEPEPEVQNQAEPMEEVAEAIEPPARGGGCATGENSTRTGGWMAIMLSGLGLACRKRWILYAACGALVLGCGAAVSDDPIAPDEPQEESPDARSAERGGGDTVEELREETGEDRPELVGLALLGEYTQILADGTETEGVISNVVFARPEELVPEFDQTLGNCSYRDVASDTQIEEPLGFSGGILQLGGEGVNEEIVFTPFDFGEAAGGFAYDTTLEDGTPGIFGAEGLVTIANEGSDDFPSLSGELPVPGPAPAIVPEPGPVVLAESGAALYTWTPADGDQVLFEWDSFLPDGSAAQLRCAFPDEVGEAVIPAEFLGPFLENPFTMSIARTSEKEWSDGPSVLRATLSRRTVTFVFP